MPVFAATFENVAVSAAQDLFEFRPQLTTAPYGYLQLHALYLHNVGGAADAGDAQEEFLRITVEDGYTTSGSGGSTVDPRFVNSIGSTGSVGSAAIEANNTTVATGGTPFILHADGWNIRVPYQMIWTPETRPILGADAVSVIRLKAAPADAINMSGTVYFETLTGN